MSEQLKEKYRELFETILKLETIEDCENFFNDLCTFKELDSMSGRIKAAKLLIKCETYDDIIKQTEISSATLSRVNKCVKYGNGYKKFL